MIARIIAAAVRNKFLVLLLTAALVVAGAWSANNIRLDALPDLSDVQVIVVADYPGQNPQVVDDQARIEESLGAGDVPGGDGGPAFEQSNPAVGALLGRELVHESESPGRVDRDEQPQEFDGDGSLVGDGCVSAVQQVRRGTGVAGLFGDGDPLGIRGGNTTLSVLFSLVFITFGALTFVLDFDQAERMVKAGVPERESWRIGFGLVVGLVWLYVEVLRLLSYFRE